MEEVGKILLFIGAIFFLLGALFLLGEKTLPFLGKLPGDIVIRGKNYTVYIPLGTSIFISILLSLLLWLLLRK